MRTTTGTPDFWGKNSISPESLLATKPLTKEPEDSGYEIDHRAELKQKIPTFSNPANQMSGTEQ